MAWWSVCCDTADIDPAVLYAVPKVRKPLSMGSPRPFTTEPINVGVELSLLDGNPLGQEQIYVRENFPAPSTGPEGFDVVIPGHPTRRVTAEMLTSFPEVEIDLVLECAGNGRILMDPVPEGTPWGLDAVSPIRVAGAHLVELLGSLPSRVSSVVFTGADEGRVPMEGVKRYQFSIDRELAQSQLPILATHINGEPLTLEHGAPVRLIVPGHYAMMSVKWLTRIEATDYPFSGHFVRKYRYYGDSEHAEGAPVGVIAVRSVISAPGDGVQVAAGRVEIRGSAWSGSGEVTGVELSLDDGDTWRSAKLPRRGKGGRFAPVPWAVSVDLEPGPARVISRAHDSTGASQPLVPRWNSNGYANNVVQIVNLTVV